MAQANLRACPAPKAAGGVFNIACGERYSLLGLVARLAEISGGPAQARHTEPRPGDVPHSQADISLARITLGYEPAVEFSTGLAKTVEDWKDGRMEGWKDGGWEDCRLTQLYELYKPGPVR